MRTAGLVVVSVLAAIGGATVTLSAIVAAGWAAYELDRRKRRRRLR